MSDDPMRDLARRLFGRDTEPAEEAPTPTGNYSPREGNTPPTNDDPMRTYVTALFERAHHQL
ncbi:hypothetical protein [Nocardioides caldifontis]|uniref:hypothetical protein n=1 Tax=Nocardioides caldifontis TaxID=2588938 RepID=UPI0011E068EE|nr:hypothetical protein [Nocardioides caldifontis]